MKFRPTITVNGEWHLRQKISTRSIMHLGFEFPNRAQKDWSTHGCSLTQTRKTIFLKKRICVRYNLQLSVFSFTLCRKRVLKLLFLKRWKRRVFIARFFFGEKRLWQKLASWKLPKQNTSAFSGEKWQNNFKISSLKILENQDLENQWTPFFTLFEMPLKC